MTCLLVMTCLVEGQGHILTHCTDENHVCTLVFLSWHIIFYLVEAEDQIPTDSTAKNYFGNRCLCIFVLAHYYYTDICT